MSKDFESTIKFRDDIQLCVNQASFESSAKKLQQNPQILTRTRENWRATLHPYVLPHPYLHARRHLSELVVCYGCNIYVIQICN